MVKPSLVEFSLPQQSSTESLTRDPKKAEHAYFATSKKPIKIRADVLREKSAVLAAKYDGDKSSPMVLDGLDDTTIRCIATWIEHGTYNMPTYAPAISALENPSAHVQRLTAMHRENIVGDNDGSAGSLRRNKGVIDLSRLVAQTTPNIEAHVHVYKAGHRCAVKGLANAAFAAFRQSVAQFQGHPEVKRVVDSGLPFTLEALR